MKKIFLPILFGFVLLITVMLIKTFTFTSRQMLVEPQSGIQIDIEKAAIRLSKAVQFKTIIKENDPKFNPKVFKNFHRRLKKSYPRIHRKLTRELVNKYSLL